MTGLNDAIAVVLQLSMYSTDVERRKRKMV